jgi:hypothetical protein
MKLQAFLLIATTAAGACGPSTSDVCSQYAQVWCDKQYSCKTGADLATLQTKYGADVPTCVKVFEQQEGCGNTTQILCPAGTSYDTGRAQECTTQYQQLMCSDVNANKDPSQCSLPSYICH